MAVPMLADTSVRCLPAIGSRRWRDVAGALTEAGLFLSKQPSTSTPRSQ